MPEFNVWSPLRRPEDWQLADIEQAGGFYHLVAIEDQGNAIDLFPSDPLQHGCEQYRGVIYIGKTSNFKDRFWRLVRSWRPGNPPADLHESKITWNTSSQLQQQYPSNRVRCRYYAVGNSPAGKSLPDDVKKIQDAIFGADDDGRKTSQPTASAVMTLEASDFIKYEKCFGQLPPLNTKPADRPQTLPNAANRMTAAQEAEADAVIDLPDTANDAEARRLIQEDQAKRQSAGD